MVIRGTGYPRNWWYFAVLQFDADVLGCNINAQSDMVEVLDTWNPSAPIRGNSGDTLINTFLFSGSSQNGRITCE